MAMTMVGFDTEDEKFDASKYIRQLRAIVRWKWNGGAGSLVLPTGFGKSITAFIAVHKLKKKNKAIRVIVSVPTRTLKRQWDKQILTQGLSDNMKVCVINTIALNDVIYDCDLFIPDECHLTAGDEFFTLYRKVRTKFIMPLTGTMFRLDGRDHWITDIAPICDQISVREAVEKGWLAENYTFNLSVPLSRKDAKRQVNLNKLIRQYMSKFGKIPNKKAFNVMLMCMDSRNAFKFARRFNFETRDVIKWAVHCNRLIKERTDFVNNTERKIEATLELINEFKVRTITFSQSIAFSDEITKGIEGSVGYHSKIDGITRPELKTKTYKTLNGARNFMSKVEGSTISHKDGNHIVSWYKEVKVSGDRLAEENLDRFLKGEVDNLNAAKAINQGFDDTSVVLGIKTSGTSSHATYDQIKGRVIRVHKVDGVKIPKIFINIYIPDWCVANSIDEQKLRLAQVNDYNVVWSDDIDEVKRLVWKILNR